MAPNPLHHCHLHSLLLSLSAVSSMASSYQGFALFTPKANHARYICVLKQPVTAAFLLVEQVLSVRPNWLLWPQCFSLPPTSHLPNSGEASVQAGCPGRRFSCFGSSLLEEASDVSLCSACQSLGKTVPEEVSGASQFNVCQVLAWQVL